MALSRKTKRSGKFNWVGNSLEMLFEIITFPFKILWEIISFPFKLLGSLFDGF